MDMRHSGVTSGVHNESLQKFKLGDKDLIICGKMLPDSNQERRTSGFILAVPITNVLPFQEEKVV